MSIDSVEAKQHGTSGSKFIGEVCLSLSDGLGSLPSSSHPEPPNNGTADVHEGGVVERAYRATLQLRDYITNMFVVLAVQMNFIRNKTSGSSKITTKMIQCDNNGVKSIAPDQDKGVCCMCTNNTSCPCSVYKACKRRCPNAIHRGHNGLPIIMESDEEQDLENNELALTWINKRRAERSNNTRRIYSRYERMLTKEFIPQICSLIEMERITVSRLKTWIISMCSSLRSIYEKQDVELVLKSFFPPWYDTTRLSKLIERLERHIGIELKVKQSLQEFNSSVDQFFANRVFLEGNGSDGQPVVVMPIDPEWNRYPAHDFYLIYNRVVESLRQVKGRNFTVLFCTILKERVIENKIKDAISGLKDTVAEDIKCDGDKSVVDSKFLVSLEETYSDDTSMLVTGKELGILIEEVNGCSVHIYEAFRAEQTKLADWLKPFINCYGK